MIDTGAVIASGEILSRHVSGDLCDPDTYLSTCYPKAQIQPLSWVSPSARPMVARINHGIWIASCECGANGLPAPGCIVFLDIPWGWCVRCSNRNYGGFWRPITIPDADQRRLIEAVLLCRPNVNDRNWEPWETVEMLCADNAAHGDPIPDLDTVRIGPIHGPSIRDLDVTPFSPAVLQAVRPPGRSRGLLNRIMGR